MRDRLAMLVCALALSACGPAAPAPAPPRATPTSSGGARPAADATDTPVTPSDEPAPTLTDDAARAGQTVFTRACAPCHRTDTFGGSLANRRLTVERVRASLHTGSDGEALLPVVPPALLSQDDVAPLMAYLRAIGAAQ